MALMGRVVRAPAGAQGFDTDPNCKSTEGTTTSRSRFCVLPALYIPSGRRE
jgi:hypothetical protein